MKLMRSNDYKNDPYSYNDPMRAICSRGDLIDPAVDTPRAKGCYDTKITDFYLASQLTSFALSGPTTDHGMKPFSWSSFNSTVPLRHEGMPDTYSFGFVEMKPDLDRVFSSSKKCVECVV